jgi:hypothetical protein
MYVSNLLPASYNVTQRCLTKEPKDWFWFFNRPESQFRDNLKIKTQLKFCQWYFKKIIVFYLTLCYYSFMQEGNSLFLIYLFIFIYYYIFLHQKYPAYLRFYFSSVTFRLAIYTFIRVARFSALLKILITYSQFKFLN